MSSFLAIASTAFGALDSAFGDLLTITPQAAGEFVAAGPDPANGPFTALGVLDLEAIIVEDSGGRNDARSEVSTTAPIAEFAYGSFSGRPIPATGARIDAPPSSIRPPTNGFLIVARLPDGADGRIRFQLAAL